MQFRTAAVGVNTFEKLEVSIGYGVPPIIA